MKLFTVLVSVAGIVFGFAVPEREIAKHRQWMDDAQDLKEEVRDALDAKAEAKAAGPARRLVAISESEVRFWKWVELPEAAKLEATKVAENNLAAARSLEAAARTGDLTGARNALSGVETACRTCHDLHFEKRFHGNGAL